MTHRIIPVEATEGMRIAGGMIPDAFKGTSAAIGNAEHVYAAMLAAAPPFILTDEHVNEFVTELKWVTDKDVGRSVVTLAVRRALTAFMESLNK